MKREKKTQELSNFAAYFFQKKCDRYWPAADTETYGVFETTLTKEEPMANYTVRTIKLKHTKVRRTVI